MALPITRSSRRTTSLQDTSESDKLESTSSWDALEWTKIEPVSRSVLHVNLDFLLEGEEVVVEGYGVVLVNTDEAGTLLVTNFRLVFLSEGTRNIIGLGTIPLATIEKFSKMAARVQSTPHQYDKTTSQGLLQVIGKDMRIIIFSFRPRTKQLLEKGSYCASMSMIENGSFTLYNDMWRISSINSNYTMCQSYPFALIVPKGISDEEVI